MKAAKRVLLSLLVLAVLLAGCGRTQKVPDYTKGDNAAFATAVAKAVTARVDTPDLLYAENPLLYDLDEDPLFQPCFAMMYFKAEQDAQDPALVHYSCRIPGLVGTCFNMAYDQYTTAAWEHCKWVSVEGDLRVVTDANGVRRISLTDTNNVFTTYASLRYMNPLVFESQGIDPASVHDESQRADVLNLLLNLGCSSYAQLCGKDAQAYADEVVIPELKDATQDLQRYLASGQPVEGSSYTIPYYWYASDLPGRVLIIAILLAVMIVPAGLIVFLIFNKGWRTALKRRNYARIARKKNASVDDLKFAISCMEYPRDKQLLRELALTNRMSYVRKQALNKLPYPEERETILQVASREQDDDDVSAAFLVLPYPEEREALVAGAKRGIAHAVRKLPYPEERAVLIEVATDEESFSPARQEALDKLPYPEEREALRVIALEDEYRELRLAALKTLPYPEERETIARAALQDDWWDNRSWALHQLQYPQDRAILAQAAREDEAGGLREFALKQLCYPEDADALRQAALKDESSDNRSLALQKLPYPAERATWEKAALKDASGSVTLLAAQTLTYDKSSKALARLAEHAEEADVRKVAIPKLPYPDERALLARLALQEPEAALRLVAVEKLAYPANRDVLLTCACEDEDADVRKAALKKLSYPEDRDVLVSCATKDEDDGIRETALGQLPYPEERDVLVRAAMGEDGSITYRCLALSKLPFLKEPDCYIDGPAWMDESPLKRTIALAEFPRVPSDELLGKLCTSIQDGLNEGYDQAELTLAGWSAAALGRCLVKEMKPADIAPNRVALSRAIDHRNEIVDHILELQEVLEPYEGQDLDDLRGKERDMVQEALSKLRALHAELDRGLGHFMLDNGDLPFSYLTHLLYDSSSKVPNFIKQGVIMGLVDWLGAHATQPDARELLRNLVAVRADIIRSDNDLSFFELRVPGDCSEDEYAYLLADVLHCSNPSLSYANTEELLARAVQEVPGCMRMLRVCPLRLIDPVNQQTLGFYKFRPYIHALWCQFVPPEGAGKVIARYHEVDDRTKPLSSGLNLRLFLDPYAVIPTIFHEFQHFKGDPNEASVFLKTQVFSIAFYQKYREANPRADVVFARLTDMLGLPPEAAKVGELNAIIQDCYGVQTSREEAERHADFEITQLNWRIADINSRETWDSAVRYPQFADGEDEKNRDLIREILVRFDTVPKSISEDEFRAIAQEGEGRSE